jgi:RNA polymerase sigma-70 factor (ECF subfamily)
MARLGELEPRLKSLMLAGLAGDSAAHCALLKELGAAFRRYYGRRLGPGAADVEDLVQEALIAVHGRRATYQPEAPFTVWAYAIARYKLIDLYRRQGRRQTVPLEDAGVLFIADHGDAATAGRDLDRVLAGISPQSATLIRHTHLEGRSARETAELTGLSESAVKVAIHRALKKLSARFDRGGDDADR